MSHRDQNELDLSLDPLPETPAPPKPGLTISATAKKPLSPAQVEFNKRMKALEKERAAHELERSRLDEHLRICITELMPLLETMNRAERDVIHALTQARINLKLTPKRHKWLGDLISNKASELLADSVGLSQEDLDHLEALIEKLGPSLLDEERKEIEQAEFEDLRSMVEEMAQKAGVKLDLDGIDLHGDP
jgi:hypothetical protein